jgi:hypothetical protein
MMGSILTGPLRKIQQRLAKIGFQATISPIPRANIEHD